MARNIGMKVNLAVGEIKILFCQYLIPVLKTLGAYTCTEVCFLNSTIRIEHVPSPSC